MASYGSFETNREVASGHGSVVYSARKSSETANSYAIKVFTLQRDIGADQESHDTLSGLLEDLAFSFTEHVTQQQKAAGSSKNIAPIFEFGNQGESAWYVTKLYPRTVHKIIEGRVALSYEALFHVIESVLTGCRDLKKICGRSHGNLKSANVLVGGGTKIREAEVVISDPLSGGVQDAGAYERADLRAIGQIIFQLVRQRELTNESNWLILPVESSVEWTKLFGKNSPAWLALCNRLLDTNLSLEEYGFDQLASDLEPLRPKPPVSGRVVAIVAVALVLVVAGLIFFLHRPTRLTIDSSPPEVAVFENGNQLTMTTAGKLVKMDMPPGEHALTARYNGLADVVTNFTLERGETKAVHLGFDFGTVRLESQPPGASIRADGKDLGKTPLTLFQKPGTIVYEFSLGDDYESSKPSVAVRSGETTNLPVVVLKSFHGGGTDAVVTFNSDPDNAVLILNGAESGRMTVRRVLASGTNSVEARYRDWPPLVTNLVLAPGLETNVNFVFDYASVRLQSDPPGAYVHVGTNQFGPTPVTMNSSTGQVVFRFERPGFETTNLTYNIVKGGMFVLNPKLISTNAILEITSDPPQALITLVSSSGKQVLGSTAANSALVTNLPPGDFTITAHIDGLDDKVITKSAPKGVPTPFAFSFDYGTVQLNSDTPNTVVTMGPTRLGTAPFQIFQKPGLAYAYRFATPDYEPFDATNVVVGLKAMGGVTAKLLPNKVSIALSSDPPAAILFDGSENLGLVEQNQKLRWGDHKLRAEFKGLDPVSADVPVARNGISQHLFQFSYGTASITSSPPGVVILSSTGQKLGVTPTNFLLKLGPVSYQLVYDTNMTNIGTVIHTGMNLLGASFGLGGRLIEGSFARMQLISLEKLPAATPGGKEGGFVGRYEVTQGEFEKVTGGNPSLVKGDPRQPVENISWSEAMAFCQKLSQLEKDTLPSGLHYALPTEAQWRFFAEGTGKETAVVGRLKDDDTPAPVGSTQAPNKYGLYDVVGNVWEWCDGPESDKPMRGWAFNSTGGFTKTFDLETRSKGDPALMKRKDVGFRVVLVP